MLHDVEMRMRGLMTEKFIQRALVDGLEMYNIRRTDGREIRFEASEQNSKQLLKIAETYHLDVTITGVKGLSLIKSKILHRPTLPVFAALSLIFVSLFLSRLWIIEWPPGTSDELKQALKTVGVAPGVALNMIDTRAIEDALYALSGEHAFVGARIDGVRLKITTVKELPEPEIFNLDGARDLVASRDSLLVSVNALSGIADVKPGDTVRRGQLLIKGEEKISDELTRGVCALGSVVGRCWVSDIVEGSMTYVQEVETGARQTASVLRFIDWSLPLSEPAGYETEIVTREQLPVGGMYLPLEIVRATHHETAFETKMIDEEALKASLSERAMENALRKVPDGAEIVDKWTDYSMIEDEMIRARAVIEVRMNIAVAQNAVVEE